MLAWIAHQGTSLWRRWILLLLRAWSSPLRGRALWDFPCLHCHNSWCCQWAHFAEAVILLRLHECRFLVYKMLTRLRKTACPLDSYNMSPPVLGLGCVLYLYPLGLDTLWSVAFHFLNRCGVLQWSLPSCISLLEPMKLWGKHPQVILNVGFHNHWGLVESASMKTRTITLNASISFPILTMFLWKQEWCLYFKIKWDGVSRSVYKL